MELRPAFQVASVALVNVEPRCLDGTDQTNSLTLH